MRKRSATIGLVLVLTGCASSPPPNLPAGQDAYRVIAPAESAAPRPYRIGPLDILSVNVFRVPSLTLEGIQVDAGGRILYPLLGELQAGGRTPAELAADISTRLRQRYLENPQVSVLITRTTSQNVTVLGSVTEPGIYELKGPATLLDALALAKGTQRVAKIREVVVFRTVDGQRMGALFDVRAIQRGEAADPEIRGNDTVVVGLDHVEAAWRDLLLAAPLLNVFTVLR